MPHSDYFYIYACTKRLALTKMEGIKYWFHGSSKRFVPTKFSCSLMRVKTTANMTCFSSLQSERFTRQVGSGSAVPTRENEKLPDPTRAVP